MLAIGLPLLWQECSPALWCDFLTLRWQNADCWRQSPSFVLTLSDRGLQCSPLCCSVLATTTTTAPVNGLFSRTVWVSRYQNCRTSMDINEARDDRVLEWQLDNVQKQSAPRSGQITTPTPHHSSFTGRMLFLTPNQQCQSTKGKWNRQINYTKRNITKSRERKMQLLE